MTVTVNDGGMLSGVLAAVATRKSNKSKEIHVGSMFEPTPEQFAALTARPADTPVVMVNLLKFKTAGGLEAYQQYGREVAPHLQRVGATLRYAGEAPELVIGDGDRPWWDAILLVEYPTPTRSSIW
jgi:hypothetical protein